MIKRQTELTLDMVPDLSKGRLVHQLHLVSYDLAHGSRPVCDKAVIPCDPLGRNVCVNLHRMRIAIVGGCGE